MPAVAGRADRVTAASPDLERPLARATVSDLARVDVPREDHWRQVASIGLDLAARTPGCDLIVVVLFAVLHDAQRIGDEQDPPHGARGAALARSLDLGRFGFGREQLALVEAACRDHTGGALSDGLTLYVDRRGQRSSRIGTPLRRR